MIIIPLFIPVVDPVSVATSFCLGVATTTTVVYGYNNFKKTKEKLA